MAAKFLMIPDHAPATVTLIHVPDDLLGIFGEPGVIGLGGEVELHSRPTGVGLIHPAVGGDIVQECVAGPLAVAKALVGFVVHLKNRVQGGVRLHGIYDRGQTELANETIADDLVGQATEVTVWILGLRVGREVEVPCFA